MAGMWIKNVIMAALREAVLPELAALSKGQVELTAGIASANQRLDDFNQRLSDINVNLVEQSLKTATEK